MEWPLLPQDAIDWLRWVFAEANRKTAERLLNVPNSRETSLDDGLVEAIVPFSPPRLLPSGAVVELQIHNIGGLRRLGKWETADIAVLVFVYRAELLIGQKIGLLQSKRLFPENNMVDEEDPLGFAYGMNKFLRRESTSPLSKVHVQFDFSKTSKYASLKSGSDQTDAIDYINSQLGEALYYLFYNPPELPTTIRYPVVSYNSALHAPLGCRVYSVSDVNRSLNSLPVGASPSVEDLESTSPSSNWRLEDWVELLVRCKAGQQFDSTKEETIGNLLERRSGPIAAAIAVSIALPTDQIS